ncbi:MAG: CDP-6-deoxy-delta-3,4-glucoseen reductase [Chromatiaceae bacterium]|jgi:CDP-4-dehydro-6-deoxyglucose reductase|nr:CDP-6-deoxy-delta-3,4-glucoseen reductase [Chromatiaceae bacterium]
MSFNVRTEPGGHAFEVEDGENLLAAALHHGIGLPYGCRNGQCGTCAATLLEGEITYPGGAPGLLLGQSEDTCLTCQAVPQSDLLIEVHEVTTTAEVQVRTLPCRVVAKEQMNHDVVRLYLKLPDGQRLQFFAGQYLDFILADGRKRAFSIANAPHDDELVELHVRHVPGGEFTDYVFDSMKEKTIMRIQAPLGTFILREDSDRPMIFMGGGTGFAPIKGIIEHALHLGIERAMHLYWGVRARRDLYLPQLPEQWARDHKNLTYTPVLSEPDDDWAGRTGFVHEAVIADYPDISGFDVYMSGPPVMVDAGRQAFEARGLTMDHMFSDAFEYAADSNKKTGKAAT